MRTLREQRVHEIIDENTSTRTKVSDSNLPRGTKDLVRDLEKVRITEVNKWWEKITLTKYLEYKRIPRGLRIL